MENIKFKGKLQREFMLIVGIFMIAIMVSGVCNGNVSIANAQVQSEETYIVTAPQLDAQEDMVDYIRSAMIARKKTIQFIYNTTDTKEQCMEMIERVIAKAFEHTGKPNEGDYLRWQYQNYQYKLSGTTTNMVDWTQTITITFNYYSTKAQEDEVTDKIDKVIKSLKLDGKTDAQKVSAIYEYICKNVVYDDNFKTTKNNISYTAYAALINKTSVCQGHSNLLYRMLLTAGIDNRIVYGRESKTGEAHSWNIVKLGSKYYYLDATWDAVRYPSTEYYLKGTTDFDSHTLSSEYTTASFKKQFPMSTTAYKDANELADGQVTSVKNEASGLLVKWKKVSGAKGYYIYRKTGSGAYKLLTTIKKSGTVSYTDKKVSDGKIYAYRVIPYNDYVKGNAKNGMSCARVGKVSIKSLKNSASAKMTVKYGKLSAMGGYEIQYSTVSSFANAKTVSRTQSKSASAVISSLKKNKTYYVRVRAYKKNSGNTYYGKWSNVKKVKISR